MSLLVITIISSLINITISISFFTRDLQECINSQRIIGGICTSIDDRPFQALLLIRNKPKCGGTIISKRWIITAAHCVQNVPERYITISVGSSKVGGLTAQFYGIDDKIVHENPVILDNELTEGPVFLIFGYVLHLGAPMEDPSFWTPRASATAAVLEKGTKNHFSRYICFFANRSMVGNDIALLKTSERIKYNDRVRPIGINRVRPKVGDGTMVSGYGVTAIDKFRKTSEYLMSVDGKVISTKQCKSILRKIEPQISISNGTFCAGSLNGGKDSCHGDSGGPITAGNVLIGIVSWGLKCAEKMMPAFYTDVSDYINWIMKSIRHNVCRKKRKEKKSRKSLIHVTI